MGGMAAQIPIKDNAAANKAAMEKVRADKLREVLAGHDGFLLLISYPRYLGSTSRSYPYRETGL